MKDLYINNHYKYIQFRLLPRKQNLRGQKKYQENTFKLEI